MRRYRDPPLTFVDRLAMAFAGGLFAALTLFGWVLASAAFFPRAALGLGVVFTSWVGAVAIGLGALLGACLGPQRLAEMFSLLWGTHPAWESRGRGYWALAWLLLLIVTVVAALRLAR